MLHTLLLQALASWYKALVTKLAHAGYVVVQYDTNQLRLGAAGLPAMPFNIEDEVGPTA